MSTCNTVSSNSFTDYHLNTADVINWKARDEHKSQRREQDNVYSLPKQYMKSVQHIKNVQYISHSTDGTNSFGRTEPRAVAITDHQVNIGKNIVVAEVNNNKETKENKGRKYIKSKKRKLVNSRNRKFL